MILLALAILAADPSNLSSVMTAAKPGDTVRLVAGTYAPLAIRARSFAPPLTVDATAAVVGGVQIIGSTGVHWVGGTIKGNPRLAIADGYGVSATASRDIWITNVHLSDLRNGIVFDRIDGGQITGNWLQRMSVDGVDIALSHGLTVVGNACSEFNPGPGAHPDCIQLWSRAGEPPTGDIKIVANSALGSMQGISLFNHLRDGGIDDGGFDRVMITGNTVLNTYANGIAAYDCRGCAVRNNSVSSLPNFINRAQLYIAGGSVEQCGNSVPMVPRQATPACPTGG